MKAPIVRRLLRVVSVETVENAGILP